MIGTPEFRILLLVSSVGLTRTLNVSRIARSLGISRGKAEALIVEYRRAMRNSK